MKDYSKVKYVKPSVDGIDITKGKVYECIMSRKETALIKDDDNFDILIYIDMCPHLGTCNWIPCDENGKEIELCDI